MKFNAKNIDKPMNNQTLFMEYYSNQKWQNICIILDIAFWLRSWATQVFCTFLNENIKILVLMFGPSEKQCMSKY